MSTIVAIKKRITPILHESDVEFAGIFGSTARGKAKKNSDIDILIRFKEQKSLLEIIDLEMHLSRVLDRKVDLVTSQALCRHIRSNVLHDLQPIYGTR